MARWITSTLGAVNLDQLTQLGVEAGPMKRDAGYTFDIIGWSPTGDRFAVREGFLGREAALAAIAGLVDPRGPIYVDAQGRLPERFSADG